MSPYFILKIVLRLVLICGSSVAAIFIYLNGFPITSFFVFFLVIVFFIELYFAFYRPFQDIQKTLRSMLSEDFSMQTSSSRKGEIFGVLSQVYEKQRHAFFEQESVKLIYDNLFNGISTGVLILRKSDENDWEIFLMNLGFAEIFQIPKFASWHNLQRNLPQFTQKLESIDFSTVQQTLDIAVDHKEKQAFSLKTSTIQTYNYTYFTVLLDSVQSIVEKKEKQAWYDLMKVIAHEIMNTLTPINSLVGSLQYYADKEQWEQEDENDFKESLKTIQKKTVQMLAFVDNYRQLSQFPQAQKSHTNLVKLVEGVIEMMQSLANEKGIKLKLIAEFPEIYHTIDPNLTEHVLVNLITNSLHALEKSQKKQKEIRVRIRQETSRTFIEVIDNGIGIDPMIREKIFIPFFTTREKGAGIGLSLSKNCMEAQDGYLNFQSNESETVFLMTFV